MSMDTLIVNPGRLRILTALASEPRQEFVRLRGATRMTDGNLATHARRLHSAGLVEIDKSFRDGKPVTTFSLTDQGRTALHAHVQRLVESLQPIPVTGHSPGASASEFAFATGTSQDDDWID
jgi:DNA-binding MarR family transcriptional regulator